jgi:hypothetical protein
VRDEGVLLYFRQIGPLQSDSKKSPLVIVFPPRRKRGVLTTVGEVHFLATPLSTFPALNKINKRFRDWLGAFPCVFSHRPEFVHDWDYYLEGSCLNCDSDIFALPAGIGQLRNGSYFVAANDNEARLDLVCRALELRGVEGIT